jgi:hypothetical protein
MLYNAYKMLQVYNITNGWHFGKKKIKIRPNHVTKCMYVFILFLFLFEIKKIIEFQWENSCDGLELSEYTTHLINITYLKSNIRDITHDEI